MFFDTIAAIASPYGRGAVSMIRISGSEALTVADRIFIPKSKKPFREAVPTKAVYGDLYSCDELVDDCVAIYYRSPHSYTGEDTVEVFCHGGILVTNEVLKAILVAGARPAEAGEFSKRAFINGKLSLSQAESVISTIDAKSTEALKLARSHRDGVFTKEIERHYNALLNITSSIYAYADYPDEDLTDMSADEMKRSLKEVSGSLTSLLGSYKRGKAISEGIYTAILGKPNTGKSALLNMLLGEDRAIVSSVEGTTRDRIEEDLILGKVKLRIADTAGIRSSDDAIENIGIEKSIEAMEKADLVFAVFDSSSLPDEKDEEFIKKLKALTVPVITLMNKCDEKMVWEGPEAENKLFISAKNALGVNEITSLVEKLFTDGDIDYSQNAVIANTRQKALIERALSLVNYALDALKEGFTPDVAGTDLENAMAALAECDGRAVSEDIANAIFSRFCVGK